MSRFPTGQTHHRTDSLRALREEPAWRPLYDGPAVQCQATSGLCRGCLNFSHRRGLEVRCCHAARLVRDGALICGIHGRTGRVLVVPTA